MLTTTSQKDTKTFVSALRRELKARNLELSHNKLLDAVAIAMGFSGAEELSKKLPESTPTDTRNELNSLLKYPLANTGQYDFAKSGDLLDGQTLGQISGTLEDIFECVAWVNEGTRKPNGDIKPGYLGETDINWNGQKGRRSPKGMLQFTLEGEQTFVSAERLFIVPEGLGAEVAELFADPTQTVLAVRTALVAEYVSFYSGSVPLRPAVDDVQAVSAVCRDAAQVLGFQMTEAEVLAFCEKMKAK